MTPLSREDFSPPVWWGEDEDRTEAVKTMKLTRNYLSAVDVLIWILLTGSILGALMMTIQAFYG